MIHDFGIVWSERSLLLSGLGNTAILSVLSAVTALLIGFILTPALMSMPPMSRLAPILMAITGPASRRRHKPNSHTAMTRHRATMKYRAARIGPVLHIAG